jgi:crotonobetaine/carnitine-CoA ligase
MVSAVASLLMAQPERPSDAENPLNAIYMGPPIPEVDRFRARFRVPHIFTSYGATETASVLRHTTVASASYANCGKPDRLGPSVLIVDEHDQPVAVGEQGELIVRPQVPWTMFTGYKGRPEETVKAWRNGWFHTGDIFRENSEGEYIFVDRASGRLRRRGYNFTASEVQRQVVAHEAVHDCAVVPVPSALGEDDIHAVVVVENDALLTHQELADFLVARLPRYALPRYIEFVDGLPRSEATLRVNLGELKARGVSAGAWDNEEKVWVAGQTTPPPSPR